MPKTLTVTDLSQYLGLDRKTIYKLLKYPEFPAPIKLPPGFKKRWNVEDVDAWRLCKSAADEA